MNTSDDPSLINTSWLYTFNIRILWNIGLTVEKNCPRGEDDYYSTSISLNIGNILYKIRLYVSIKGK